MLVARDSVAHFTTNNDIVSFSQNPVMFCRNIVTQNPLDFCRNIVKKKTVRTALVVGVLVAIMAALIARMIQRRQQRQ